MKPVFPWTDAEGNFLSDQDLKAVSKDWSPETWEAYLETQEHNESELVTLLEDLPAIKDKVTEDFRCLLADPSPLKKELVQEVRGAVKKLSPRKKEIIVDTYWKEISERDQAKEGGVVRGSIYWQKQRAKGQLKKILLTESEHLGKWKRRK